MKHINGLVDITLLMCACALVHCKPIQNSNTQENGSNSPSKSHEEFSHLSSIGKTTRNHSQKNAVDDYEKHNRNYLMSSFTDSFKQGEPSNTKMSSEKFSGTDEKNFPWKFSKLSRSDFRSPADEVGKLERKGIYGGTIKNKKSSAATYKGTDSKQSNDNRNSVRKHPKATRKGGSTDNTKKGSKISTKPETPIQDMHKEIKYPDTRKKENKQSAIPEKYIVETKDGEASSVAESEYEESNVHDEILENGSSRNVEESVTKEELVGNSPALPDMIRESSISEHSNNIVTTNTVGTGDVTVTNTGKEEAPVETTALRKTTLNKDDVVNVTKVVDRSNDSREENSTVRAVITEISTLSEMETTENDAASVTAAVENSRTLVDLKTTMSVKERETESILPDTAEIDEKVDHTQTTETEEILQDRYTTASPSETKTKSFTSRGSTSREKREEVSHEIFPEEATTFSPQSSDTPRDAETSIKAETEALPTSTERDTSSSLTETVGTTHSVSVAGESGETRTTTVEEGKISSESSVTITEIFPTNEPESDTDSDGITSAVPDKETEASASTQVTEKDFPMETITSQESTTIPDEVTDSPKKEVTETHEEEDLPSETITNQEITPSPEEVTSTPKEEVTETQEKDLPSETLPSQENTPSTDEVTSSSKEEVTETQNEKDLPSETLPSQENTPSPEEVTSTLKEEVTETQEEKDLPSETLPSQENTPSPEEVTSTPKEEVTETPPDVSKEDSTQSKTTSIHESTTSSDLTSVDDETETVSPESVTTEKKGDPTETTTTSGESASDIVTSPTAEKETQTESFEGEATETTVSSFESSTIKLEPTSNTQSSTPDITKDATFPDVEEATKASPSSTETTMTTHETPTSTFESSLSTRGSTSETRHPNPTTKSDATTGEDSGNLTSPGEEPKDVCQVSDEEADTYIDDAITRLIPRIPEPSNMPNRTGRFYLYNGILHGLSTVHRSGSSRIYCRHNFVYFKVPAGAKNLQATYDWHYRAFFRNWQGTVLFSVREFKTDALYVAVKERGNSGLSKLRVKNFKIDSIDGLRVEFTGLGPLNRLASFFTRIVMSTFRNSLARSIEKPIEDAMNEELEKHNWK